MKPVVLVIELTNFLFSPLCFKPVLGCHTALSIWYKGFIISLFGQENAFYSPSPSRKVRMCKKQVLIFKTTQHAVKLNSNVFVNSYLKTFIWIIGYCSAYIMDFF